MGEGEPQSGRGWAKKWDSGSKKWERVSQIGRGGAKSDKNYFYNPI